MASSVTYVPREHKVDGNNNVVTQASKTPSISNTTDRFDIPSVMSSGMGDGNTPLPLKDIKTTKKDYSTSKKLGNMTIDQIVNKMNTTVHIPNGDYGVQKSFQQTVDYYNRFKVANPNAVLQKGFAHVFFVRPDCNLLENGKLIDSNQDSIFTYAWKHTPDMIRELVQKNGTSKHDFMLSISNATASFSPSDEYINTDSYGKTYTGYKIAYGKNNTESKTAGTFNITFKDDRNLHIYQIHRLWIEYINGVYRGKIAPKHEYVIKKILDYASCCYYFVTAEDGETIIFWSKYYGVFPTTIPVGQYSWAEGNVITQPTLDISYQYSFKEDFNPYTFVEFNYNSRVEGTNAIYLPTYDKNLGHVGRTWVGAPFVERVETTGNNPYQFKLRFKEK